MDTLIDALPGFPDGVSRSEDGNFWIAIVAPRTPLVPLLRYGTAALIPPRPWHPHSG